MPRNNTPTGALSLAGFRQRLLRWFGHHHRELPWRGERNPYRILVSEIMLQQTRVAVVEDRYRKFVARFPTPQKLARAREQTVLAAWSGLGYYRRARNLRAAARKIAAQAEFPRTAAALRELPGIGRYTANAVASIAFGEPVAVVDGNVKRVLDRLFGDNPGGAREEQYWEQAGQLLDQSCPGDFNQAMMELGALVCLPGEPVCRKCPVAFMCATRGPVARKQREVRRKAVARYALARKNGSVLLRQRPAGSSLMPGMWELPLIQDSEWEMSRPVMELRHSITTTDYTVFVHAAKNKTSRGRWVPLASINRLPLTGLARKILERMPDV